MAPHLRAALDCTAGCAADGGESRAMLVACYQQPTPGRTAVRRTVEGRAPCRWLNRTVGFTPIFRFRVPTTVNAWSSVRKPCSSLLHWLYMQTALDA
eukprot:366200-Chlamydomonas_euryale.AAC.1